MKDIIGFFVLPVFFGIIVPFLIFKIKGKIKYYLGYGISILLFLIYFYYMSRPCEGLSCIGEGFVAFIFFEAGITSLIVFTLFVFKISWKMLVKLLIILLGLVAIIILSIRFLNIFKMIK
ncbi:MAG: hypothetical protein WCY28_00570 [Candidatus Shapirobacteria bacterium]|jgi:hypothetical protein